MADKETGLIVYVDAEMVKGAGKKAVRGIAKEVMTESKTKKTVVPVDISVDISNSNDKIKNAQKRVVEDIKKMTAKGFSASSDDIKRLKKELTDLGAAMDKNKVGRQNNLYKIISKQVDEIEKSFQKLQKENRKIDAKIKTANNSAKTEKDIKNYAKKQKQVRAAKRKADKIMSDSGVTQESLERDIDINKREMQNKALKSGSNRLGSKSPTTNITRAPDPGRTNDELLKVGEYSDHGSKWAEELARTLKEEYAKSAKTLVTYIDKELAKETKGGKPTDKNMFLKDLETKALSELKSLLIKQEKGDTQLTDKDYIDQLGIIRTITKEAGKDLEQTFNSIKEFLLMPYSDSPKRRKGGTWKEEGTIKGEGEGHELATETLKTVFKAMNKLWDQTNPNEAMAKRMYKDLQEITKATKKGNKQKRGSQYDIYKQKASGSEESKAIKTLANNMKISAKEQTQKLNNIAKTSNEQTKITENQATTDKIENVREAIADTTQEKITQEDLISGFNTDENAEELIDTIKEEGIKPNPAIAEIGSKLKSAMCPCKDVLDNILKEIKFITKNEEITEEPTKEEMALVPMVTKALTPIKDIIQTALVPVAGTYKSYYEGKDILKEQKLQKQIEEDSKRSGVKGVSRSEITTTVKNPASWFTKLKDVLANLTKTTAHYQVIMAKTSAEQDEMNAKLVERYGLSRGTEPDETGDKVKIARSLSLWRGRDRFKDLFKDIDLSEGVTMDTTAITDAMAKMLSGKEMFKAQTGGWLRNLAGIMTGGLAFGVQPSLEKSRGQAEGINQIMANIRATMNTVLQDILDKESKLSGLENQGKLKRKIDGSIDIDASSSETKTLVLQLEESKEKLKSILADVGAVNEAVDKSGGKIRKVIKNLGFTSTSLRKNNAILANLNAGLDKSGKAFKFQTRLAEILNYSFQLMNRHIGQMVKRWLLMLSPMNLIKKAFQNMVKRWLLMLSPMNLIKKAFQNMVNLFKNFTSYDIKWQRTMNVVKYNLRTIIQPVMEWIAQKLVNMIGFVDIISQKIQAAYGKIPISLFDQAAAESRKIHEELEAAANVTAGFDELHDIGSDNSGANNLLGDIYKPQLSEEWQKLAEKIGTLFAGIIKGDLGFGESMKLIKEILGDTLGIIGGMIWNWIKDTPVGKWIEENWEGSVLKLVGKALIDISTAIWNWFKETALGKYITENWEKILGKILLIFLGWKLLKIAGSALFNALFGEFTEGSIKGIFSKIGGWITNSLQATQFGTGIILGLKEIFSGESGLLNTLKYTFTYPNLISQMGGWGEMLGKLFAQSFIAVVGATISIAAIIKGVQKGTDIGAYNAGVEQSGGKKEDKKSNVGNVLGTTAVSAIGGAIVGKALFAGTAAAGPIGAAVAGIAALLATTLAPVIQENIEHAKNLNNELQKISYYEGAVQVAKNGADELDEMLKVLNQTLESQTNNVYKQGEALHIDEERMKELVTAVQNGTYSNDMLTESEQGLASSLEQLSFQQDKVNSTTEKLTAAKKKLQKAELDLAIAQDIEADNFEMAQARIEYALASELYSTDEAAKKMTQIMKKASTEQQTAMLKDMSPDMKKNFDKYYTTTKGAMDEIYKLYDKKKEKEREAFLQNLNPEIRKSIEDRAKLIEEEVNKHPFLKLLDIGNNGKILGISYIGHNIPGYAVGTNYVPNDGLAYLHQGEAVIPKKYNQPYQQNNNSGLENAISSLVQQVAQISAQVNQGINVKGQFVQRGSDLVATVEKASNQLSNNILNNKVYAR